jgi:hypothetical protein
MPERILSSIILPFFSHNVQAVIYVETPFSRMDAMLVLITRLVITMLRRVLLYVQSVFVTAMTMEKLAVMAAEVTPVETIQEVIREVIPILLLPVLLLLLVGELQFRLIWR